MSHMVVMNESLMWMDDVYCSLNGVVNSYTLLTDIYVFLFIYFYVRREIATIPNDEMDTFDNDSSVHSVLIYIGAFTLHRL